MKKLVSATALALTLAFGAGSVLAAKQNTNTPAGGGTMTASKKSHKHHRRHHRRSHKAAPKAANANT
jgi:hypothetical protein